VHLQCSASASMGVPDRVCKQRTDEVELLDTLELTTSRSPHGLQLLAHTPGGPENSQVGTPSTQFLVDCNLFLCALN
jgi:hypothetical protein